MTKFLIKKREIINLFGKSYTKKGGEEKYAFLTFRGFEIPQNTIFNLSALYIPKFVKKML